MRWWQSTYSTTTTKTHVHTLRQLCSLLWLSVSSNPRYKAINSQSIRVVQLTVLQTSSVYPYMPSACVTLKLNAMAVKRQKIIIVKIDIQYRKHIHSPFLHRKGRNIKPIGISSITKQACQYLQMLTPLVIHTCRYIVYWLVCFRNFVFVRLPISPPRIKLAVSNFARWFIGVLDRKYPILGKSASPEA